MKLKKKHTNQNFEIVDSIGKYMDDDIQRIIEGKQLELGDRELPPFDEYRIYKNIQEAVMQEEKRKNRRIRMPLFFKWAVVAYEADTLDTALSADRHPLVLWDRMRV